jgi:hypothetical protein
MPNYDLIDWGSRRQNRKPRPCREQQYLDYLNALYVADELTPLEHEDTVAHVLAGGAIDGDGRPI